MAPPADPEGQVRGPAADRTGPVWAVVVAGGNGTRFGARKQYATLDGRTLVDWSLDAARRACAGVVLVLPADDVTVAHSDEPAEKHADKHSDEQSEARSDEAGSRRWRADAVVAGGVKRSDSVRAGLAAVPPDVGVIAVHDAARPLAGPGLWEATIAAVRHGADAAIPTIAVTDTVKVRQADGTLRTLDRSALCAVQTPQAFAAGALRRAHADGGDATDDAALVEAQGGTVVEVSGDARNLKITHPDDLVVATALLPSFLAQAGLSVPVVARP